MKRKIKKLISRIIKKIEKVLGSLYHKLPISHSVKNKAKNLFFTLFGCFFKNTPSYIIWKQTRVKKKRKKTPIASDEILKGNLNKKIGIHFHLFYVDLIDEFVEYFNNIPFDFDLYISVVDDNEKTVILEKCNKIKNVKKISIKKVVNRGRDVSPFVTTFASDLIKYDYVCHVHSKKSLYTGGEQIGWRQYLLDGLLGSENYIRRVFFCFENNPEVGLIYPETYPQCPYWGHTWLSNDESRNILLEKLGYVDVKVPKYVDFPMGTMFWARNDAIKTFFKAGIKEKDFPEEKGQVDGTIAHAFERCLGVMVKLNGYTVMVYDQENDKFNYGYGNKNFKQYWAKSVNMLENHAYKYDFISFDIFDTLIMRKISSSSDIYRLVELKLSDKNINIPFAKLRYNAEKKLRKSGRKKDYSIDEIYIEFQNLTNISREECDRIKKEEIETELENVVPRKEIIEVYHFIRNELHKKTAIISDMYLTTDIIKRMLQKCGITEFDELRISCERQARKEDGSMWDIFLKEHVNQKILHIGDNEKSDVQLPEQKGIDVFHIMSSKDLFDQTNVGRKFKIKDFSTIDSIAFGIVLNRYFNSPFSQNDNKFSIKIDKPYDLGYCIIGPIVADYLMWVVRDAKRRKIDKLLMFAREGYLFNNMFNIIKEYSNNVVDISADYIYVSRRSTMVASIENINDIKSALNIYYEGSLRDLLKNRFGLDSSDNIQEIEKITDINIHLPGDATIVYNKIESVCNLIIERAEYERKNYLKYTNSIVDGKNMAVLDIGYSGSIQYYLSKITGKTFIGYYFATDNKNTALRISGNEMMGRYIENDEIQPASKSYIHRYSLLLETVLTSPDNQLCYIDDDVKPVFRKEEKSAVDKKIIEQIHSGAIGFAKDFFSTVEDLFIKAENNRNIYEEIIRLAVEENILSDKLKNMFKLEDDFCTDKQINIFDLFEKRRIGETNE